MSRKADRNGDRAVRSGRIGPDRGPWIQFRLPRTGDHHIDNVQVATAVERTGPIDVEVEATVLCAPTRTSRTITARVNVLIIAEVLAALFQAPDAEATPGDGRGVACSWRKTALALTWLANGPGVSITQVCSIGGAAHGTCGRAPTALRARR